MAESGTRNILCRYFLSNVCRDGTSCRFSHDRTTGIVDNVCQYYLKNQCRYGSRCRFDHVKRGEPTGQRELVSRGKLWKQRDQDKRNCAGASGSSTSAKASSYSDAVYHVSPEEAELRKLAQKPLCEYHMISGTCLDKQCRCVHGNFCETCNKYILHPHNDEANAVHVEECLKQQEKHAAYMTAIDRSSKLTCDVCLEVVLEKMPLTARRFGILEACPHVFCIDCIRRWRNVQVLGTNTVRGCPTCRTTSTFVTPSAFFVESPEEKKELIANYKDALSKIDCKYFEKGKGVCPFTTKCFYKHTLPDGTTPPASYYSRGRTLCDDLPLDIFMQVFEDVFIQSDDSLSSYEDYDDYFLDDYYPDDLLSD